MNRAAKEAAKKRMVDNTARLHGLLILNGFIQAPRSVNSQYRIRYDKPLAKEFDYPIQTRMYVYISNYYKDWRLDYAIKVNISGWARSQLLRNENYNYMHKTSDYMEAWKHIQKYQLKITELAENAHNAQKLQ